MITDDQRSAFDVRIFDVERAETEKHDHHNLHHKAVAKKFRDEVGRSRRDRRKHQIATLN